MVGVEILGLLHEAVGCRRRKAPLLTPVQATRLWPVQKRLCRLQNIRTSSQFGSKEGKKKELKAAL